MNRKRLAVTLIALPAAVALAACSSSSAKPKPSSTAKPTGTGSGAVTAGAPTTPGALAAKVDAALKPVTSAHLTLDGSFGGSKLTGTSDAKLSNGKTTAQRASVTVPSVGAVQVVVLDGKSYARLPAALNPSGKPWLDLTAGSSNPTAKLISGSVGSIQSAASVDSLAALIKASPSVRNDGAKTVDGTAATEYEFTVDPAELPAGDPVKQAIGSGKVPVQLWLDHTYRPVQARLSVTAAGQAVPVTIGVSDYDKPVTVTAPPADQVAH